MLNVKQMKGRWLVRWELGLSVCGYRKCVYGIGVGKCFLRNFIVAAKDNNTIVAKYFSIYFHITIQF